MDFVYGGIIVSLQNNTFSLSTFITSLNISTSHIKFTIMPSAFEVILQLMHCINY